MVWDLRGALLKKGEFETARLTAFEFLQRARTMRLMAERLFPDMPPATLVEEIALANDEAILSTLCIEHPEIGEAAMREAYTECRERARAQLIVEIGDPTPHRLA